MPGFNNGVMYANNVRFDGSAYPGQVTTDGQLLIGATASPNIRVGTIAAGSNMVVTPGAGTISVATSATPSFTSATISNSPVSSTDATNKAYVDLIAAGMEFKDVVEAASTTALTAAYLNGSSGVGATLTNSGALAAFSLDGVSGTHLMRVLIKDQASSFQNGIYSVTTVGDGSTAWVLTRTTDYDTVAQMEEGAIVPVQSGTVNINTMWMQNSVVATIGVDAITYQKFQSAPIVTTQYAVLVGDVYNKIASLATGSSGQILQSGGASANPAFSTATYPATTAQGDLLLSSTANTIGTLSKDTNATRYLSNTGTNNNAAWAQIALATGVSGTLPIANGGTNASSFTNTDGVVYFDGTGLNSTTVGTAGQVLTSNGASVAPTFQAAPIGMMTWTDVTGTTQAAAVNNGYVADNSGLVTITLPATAAFGSVVSVVGKGSGLWTLHANTGQTINFGSSASSSAGSITATNQYDAIQVLCTTANTTWTCTGVSQGNLTVA